MTFDLEMKFVTFSNKFLDILYILEKRITIKLNFKARWIFWLILSRLKLFLKINCVSFYKNKRKKRKSIFQKRRLQNLSWSESIGEYIQNVSKGVYAPKANHQTKNAPSQTPKEDRIHSSKRRVSFVRKISWKSWKK